MISRISITNEEYYYILCNLIGGQALSGPSCLRTYIDRKTCLRDTLPWFKIMAKFHQNFMNFGGD